VCQCQAPQPRRGGGLRTLAVVAVALVVLAPHAKAHRSKAQAARGQLEAGALSGLPSLLKLLPPRNREPSKWRPELSRLHPGPASRAAKADIPTRYLALYQRTGRHDRIPWEALAGIGKIESDHGRSRAPGVRSGVNAFGCCAGPMQFNLRNGPPSTWDTYGRGSPYRPEDAIPAAGRLLRASGAPGDLRGALYAYNHSTAYVDGVLNQARRYGWKGK
jgi:hypothetical protein